MIRKRLLQNGRNDIKLISEEEKKTSRQEKYKATWPTSLISYFYKHIKKINLVNI